MAAEVKGQFTRSQPCLPPVARPAAVLGRSLCRGLSPCEARVVLFAVGSLGISAPRRRAFAGLRFRVVSSTFNEVEAKTRTSPKQVLNLQQNSAMLLLLGVTGGSNAGFPWDGPPRILCSESTVRFSCRLSSLSDFTSEGGRTKLKIQF